MHGRTMIAAGALLAATVCADAGTYQRDETRKRDRATVFNPNAAQTTSTTGSTSRGGTTIIRLDPVTRRGPDTSGPESGSGGTRSYPPRLPQPDPEPVIPTGTLPAPRSSAALIQRIREKFGLKRITGSMATEDNLLRLERMLEKFPADAIRDLSAKFEHDPDFWMKNAAAYWHEIATGGEIVLMMDPVLEPTIAHEIGHHMTYFAVIPWGDDLGVALGYRRDPERRSYAWDPANVAPASYARAYSRTNAGEHYADAISVRVAADSWFLPGYRLPPAAQSVLDRKLARTLEGR